MYRHGAPPTTKNEVATIKGAPELERLSAVDNPKYFEQYLRNMFDMVIECNSRINVQGQATNAAEKGVQV